MEVRLRPCASGRLAAEKRVEEPEKARRRGMFFFLLGIVTREKGELAGGWREDVIVRRGERERVSGG